MPTPITPPVRMIRADEWAAKVAESGNTLVASTSKVSVELVRYQQLPGNYVVARRSSLLSIKAVCDTVKVEPGTKLCEAFVALKADVEKALFTIEKARKAWGAARKIFGGAGRGNGSLRALRNHAFEGLNLGEATSEDNHWLEALDPHHRPWALESGEGGMDYIAEVFNMWMQDASTTLGFFEWTQAEGHTDSHLELRDEMGIGGPKLEYMSGSERSRNRCVFQDKKVHKPSASAFTPGGLLENRSLDVAIFSTRELKTEFSQEGFAAFVCSQFGAFYTATHELGKFHHSSFLSGESVLAAGEWCVSDGGLLVITNKSGHYHTTNLNLVNALKLLAKRLDLSATVVAIPDYASGGLAGASNYYKAQDFVRAAGIESNCAPVALASGADIMAEAKKRCAANRRLEVSDFA